LSNTLFIVLPASNFYCKFFEVQPYTGDENYKWRVTLAIILCGLITIIVEKIIVIYLTAYYDRRGERLKKK